MSGLEMLRDLKNTEQITIHTGGYAFFDELDVAKLEYIADVIEHDLGIASFQMWMEMPGKPVLDDEEEFTHWLDRWYLPRPVIDGEPVQFGDEFKIHGGRVYPVSGFYIFSESPDKLYFETGIGSSLTTSVDNAERVEPDSIEKLRSEILNLTYASAEEAETIVDEWLSRAKKLFGGDVE